MSFFVVNLPDDKAATSGSTWPKTTMMKVKMTSPRM